MLFDHLGFVWDYEPDKFELAFESGTPIWYIPDFLLRYAKQAGGVYTEIKPDRPTNLQLTKCRLLAQQTGQDVILLAGNIGDHLWWEWEGRPEILFVMGIGAFTLCNQDFPHRPRPKNWPFGTKQSQRHGRHGGSTAKVPSSTSTSPSRRRP